MRKFLLISALLLCAVAACGQQTQVASDTLQNTACSSSCGNGGQLGANWTQNSGNNITESASGVSGGWSNNGYDYRDQAYWSGTGSFGNDMYSQVTCYNSNGTAAARTCGVSVRTTGTLAAQSNTTGYLFYFTSSGSENGAGTYTLYKAVAGTNTSIGSTTASGVTTTWVMNLQVIGTTLTATAGGTTIFTVTDSTITTGGAPGIIANLSGSFIAKTWSGGTATSQPTVANPTSSLATGSYTMPQTGVTLSDATGSSTICYTTDGSTPTTPGTPNGTCTNGTAYSTSLTISATTTLKLLGTKTGDINSSVVTYTYTQSQVANPTATHGNGTYNNDPVSETLSDATGSSVICYRTDGTNPAATTPGTCDAGSTTYSGAFNVSPTGGTATVKALGTETGYLNSSVVTWTYTFTVSAVADSPGVGSYTSAQTATLSIATTTGASILYTVDGSTPACPSTGTTYTTGISINATTTVKAIGCKTNYNASSVQSDVYTINICGAVTYSPTAGGYFTTQSVSLAASVCSSPTICYTTDGSTPTESANACTHGTTYSTAISVSSSETLKALATKSGYGDSTVSSAAYAINPPDQTGSYQFSDNFANYLSPVASPCTVCTNNIFAQTPLDAWDTNGNWTAIGTDGISGVQPLPNTIHGGTGSTMLYQGTPSTLWVAYTGATGWNSSGVGQYSSVYVQSLAPDWITGTVTLAGAYIYPSLHNTGNYWYQASAGCTMGSTEPNPWNQTVGGTSNDNGGSGGCTWTNMNSGILSGTTVAPAACVFTFSNATGSQLTAYSLCLTNSNGTVILNKINTGSVSTIATSSTGACGGGGTTIQTFPLELRTLGGVNQPLCSGVTPTGMSATYTDGAPITTGVPGVAGGGAFNWVGGTINASTPPSPITYTHTYPNYTPSTWTTAGDTSWETWPFLEYQTDATEEPVLTATVQNTSIAVSGSTVTMTSTLNPGSGQSIVVSGVHPSTLGGIVTTTGSNSTSYTYSTSGSPFPNSGATISGTTVTISNSSVASDLGPSTPVTMSGMTPSGCNGTFPVFNVTSGGWSYTDSSCSGTVTVLGSSATPGYGSTQSSSVYAMGAVSSTGIAQNYYEASFTPAQWILGKINVDTVNTTVRNWFFKLNGNTSILGGSGCYDPTAYYIGVEPMYQSTSNPPNAVQCAGTVEYCGTNVLHITKATPASSVDPGGGCTSHPNYNVLTVSGSLYIPMQNDMILSMYTANGYLDVYCLGTSRSATAPFGEGCPSTTNYYRVIHVADSDMLATSAAGISQGFPGVWVATEQVYDVPMAVFSNVSMGSGSTCAAITGAACIAPVIFNPTNQGPL